MRDESPGVQELFDLSGRTALITGAGSPLGFAMASALAEAGARVLAASRNLKTARSVAVKLGGKERGNHLSAVIDQMLQASIQRGFSSAAKQAGRIDILVNNGHEKLAADWRSVTGRQFTRQLANQTGYFLLARLVRDHAVRRGTSASIIMLGSKYGRSRPIRKRTKGFRVPTRRRIKRSKAESSNLHATWQFTGRATEFA